MGQNGDPAFSARNPDVGYESNRSRYLVVWQGRQSDVDGPEIYGKFVSGLSHATIGVDFKISDTPALLTSE
jgi:hypothetical protein